MRKRVAAAKLADQIEIASAGVWAEEGYGASPNALAVLAEQGVSLSEHRSRQVTAALLAQADIVLVMEEAHRRSLFNLAPRHLGKVFLLSEMAGRHDDIADPYGGPVEGYVKTVALLEKLIDQGWPRILERMGMVV